MPSLSSLLYQILFLHAITGAAASAVLSSAAVGAPETNAVDARKLALQDYCYADPSSLDVPGQIFFVCPDFCGEGNDWSVFISKTSLVSVGDARADSAGMILTYPCTITTIVTSNVQLLL